MNIKVALLCCLYWCVFPCIPIIWRHDKVVWHRISLATSCHSFIITVWWYNQRLVSDRLLSLISKENLHHVRKKSNLHTGIQKVHVWCKKPDYNEKKTTDLLQVTNTTTLQLYDNSCRSQTQQHYSYMTTAAGHKYFQQHYSYMTTATGHKHFQQHYSYMTTAADHKHNNITVIWQQLYRWREPEYKEIKKTYTWWMRDYMKMLLNFFCMLRAIQLAKKCLIIYHTSYYIHGTRSPLCDL